mmetsp:Transcript_21644/g.56462  ORF Transcript_21644/g.56462 Transcript_21644/m.56462 type:complete len:175 (+) Transcript_21644:2731-3255(+)
MCRIPVERIINVFSTNEQKGTKRLTSSAHSPATPATPPPTHPQLLQSELPPALRHLLQCPTSSLSPACQNEPANCHAASHQPATLPSPHVTPSAGCKPGNEKQQQQHRRLQTQVQQQVCEVQQQQEQQTQMQQQPQEQQEQQEAIDLCDVHKPMQQQQEAVVVCDTQRAMQQLQ